MKNPLDAPGFESKVKLLAEIDAYVRDREPGCGQATVSLGATWQVVENLPDGESYRDIRPLVRVNLVVADKATVQESGSKGYGGREGYARFTISRLGGRPPTAPSAKRWSILMIPAPAGEWMS